VRWGIQTSLLQTFAYGASFVRAIPILIVNGFSTYLLLSMRLRKYNMKMNTSDGDVFRYTALGFQGNHNILAYLCHCHQDRVPVLLLAEVSYLTENIN
jgi:hypothetical protein